MLLNGELRKQTDSDPEQGDDRQAQHSGNEGRGERAEIEIAQIDLRNNKRINHCPGRSYCRSPISKASAAIKREPLPRQTSALAELAKFARND